MKPELEIFDTGNLWFVKQMIKEGLLDAPTLIQLCMGIPYGVPADIGHLLAMVNSLPENCNWGTFAISRMQMPWVAQSILLGGNVRVGLEDNLYLSKGVYASNAQLVEKARTIIEAMGARILTPAEARERLKLSERRSNDRVASLSRHGFSRTGSTSTGTCAMPITRCSRAMPSTM